MKKNIVLILLTICFILTSCENKIAGQEEQNGQSKTEIKSLELSKGFKSLWFDGKAEIASYDLTQMRYGEAREGNAVLIFVKEPFLPEEQVKANLASNQTVDVMKLNSTKKFNTGIYPYSIMQSVFYPLSEKAHAIKVSASTQEWCGQTYMQLNNREQFDIKFHSYFEGEADQNLKLEKQLLENELWIKLRIDPKKITTGELQVIPDFSYLRLKHKPAKAYQAEIEQTSVKDTILTTLAYQNLDRKLKIYQERDFPFTILQWEEIEGTDKNITKAVLQKTMRIDYWNKNSNKYLYLRDSLKLD